MSLVNTTVVPALKDGQVSVPKENQANALAALRDQLPPSAFITDALQIQKFSNDQSVVQREATPLAVLQASNVAEVQTILRIANEHEVPIVTRGLGSGLSGGATAIDGGIVISLHLMDKIIAVHPQDEIAIVEAGVITSEISKAAAPYGLRYAPDPASHNISTIGGNIATNAGGFRCAKYGVTRQAVLGLQVVLADGTLIETGQKTIKGVAGLDLTGLFVGSEGSLGVVVQATVRLTPLPQESCTLVVFSDDIAGAAKAVQAITASPVQPAILELMDRNALAAKAEAEELLAQGNALLLVQTDGYGAQKEAAEILRAVTEAGARGRILSDEKEIEYYFAIRRAGYRASVSGWMVGEDIAVPRSKLVEIFLEIERIAKKYNLKHATVAHAGDGNLHPLFSVAKTPAEEKNPNAKPPAVLDYAADELIRAALALGGTITGEHGVGLAKEPWLELELSPQNYALQKSLKLTFDPKNLLNPGKWL